MSKKNGKTQRANLAAQMAAGAKKHFPDASQRLQVGGVTYTIDALSQALQAIADVRAGVEAAKAAAAAKIDAEEAQASANSALMNAFESVVRGMFPSADVLSDFGFAPRKRATPTALVKAAAVAKREATRKARHTMGTLQKKSIKGNVTATLVVTPSSESAPTADGGTPPAGPLAPVAPTPPT
jgi:hypothetical protein